ncbi:MAG TPA: GNAT family N-acetyltransferase [Candidatus Binatia bacterium]
MGATLWHGAMLLGPAGVGDFIRESKCSSADKKMIRPIREEDIPSVAEMMLLNWDGVMSEHHSPGVVAKFRGEVTPGWIRRQMGWKQIFVVEEASEIVATGALANFGRPDAPNHSVSQFFVRPDLHGRGIGTLLLEHLIRAARGNGIHRLHVPSSRNAVPFYQRAGFVADAVQPDVSDEITWMTMDIPEEAQNQRLQATRYPRA